jgi:hypothetical protein
MQTPPKIKYREKESIVCISLTLDILTHYIFNAFIINELTSLDVTQCFSLKWAHFGHKKLLLTLFLPLRGLKNINTYCLLFYFVSELKFCLVLFCLNIKLSAAEISSSIVRS